ncbi:TetR/AcrR family transcriptional regulator [Cellulomonas soli]|uniref:HTH tetR-type domain-containing protein n=1 Tax=Cellulomonas soli TaxID=931535 RepID=A0A512PFC8_9CELL|nr:TetR/AcrR family transcriptional regulator [Cellulomonas soli]NYI59297.1 AcrR family transcriptional regulator [Cellulomonas soli]GEP69914.1 hypothetical protein CSO01_26290 [Cellulomonas soli]
MPKIVDHAARRREITQAAADLIAEGGPSAFTMRALSARCGVANGALERYFPTKGDILVSCYDLAYSRLRAHTYEQMIGVEPGLASLRVLVRALLPVSTEIGDVARVMLAFWSELSSVPEVAARVFADSASMRDRFVAELRVAVERGEIDCSDRLDAVGYALHVFVVGSYHVAQGPEGAEDPGLQLAALDLVLGAT